MTAQVFSARRFGDLEVDFAAREVSVDGEVVHLTRTEFELLRVFAEHPPMALTRDQILGLVWGDDWYGERHLVSVHICNLRRKIRDGQRSQPLIRTLHGVGYRFDGQSARSAGETQTTVPSEHGFGPGDGRDGPLA